MSVLFWALRNWQGLVAGAAFASLAAFPLGYLKGRSAAEIEQLKATVKAYETRKKIDDAVSRGSAREHCLELGGLRIDCDKLRGLDPSTKGQ